MNTYTPEAIKKFIDNAKETQYNVKDIVESLSLDYTEFEDYRWLLDNVFDLNKEQEQTLEILSQKLRIMQKIEKAIEKIYDDEDI